MNYIPVKLFKKIMLLITQLDTVCRPFQGQDKELQMLEHMGLPTPQRLSVRGGPWDPPAPIRGQWLKDWEPLLY